MAKTPFKLKSGNNLGGRNGEGVKFKTMGSSPAKGDIVESFKNFMRSKQTKEGRDIGELKRRMRHPNIEVRMKAEKENRARLKKAKETTEPGSLGAEFKPSIFSPTSKFGSTTKDIKLDLKKTKGGLYDPTSDPSDPDVVMTAQEKINKAYEGANDNWGKASKRAIELYNTTLNELITERDSP